MLPSDFRPHFGSFTHKRRLLSARAVKATEAPPRWPVIDELSRMGGVPTRGEPHLSPPWNAENLEAHQVGFSIAGAAEQAGLATLTIPPGFAAVLTGLGFFTRRANGNDADFAPIAGRATLVIDGQPHGTYRDIAIPLGGGLTAADNIPTAVPTPLGILSEPYWLPAPIVLREATGEGRTVSWTVRNNNGAGGDAIEVFVRTVGFRFPSRFANWEESRLR